MKYPEVIQGGLGIGVSNWVLARAVSMLGQLGVVSGVVLDVVFTRRLQDGDPGGHMKRALDHFPNQEIASKIWKRFFILGGKSSKDAYKSVPVFTINPPVLLQEIAVVANFCEVWLAKEGHDGVVGVNYLEKLQMANLSAIYGAMLAGVDYVCMGAGIPREIPGVLDLFSDHLGASLKIDVDGTTAEDHFRTEFDPKIISVEVSRLKRPKFLAIVSSSTLAQSLAKKSTGKIDGFVVERPTAGGHNAPPRGGIHLDDAGEPLYGERDEVDFAKIKNLDLSFWIAGSFATFEKKKEALELGATGVQVGTAFAFCRESALLDIIKQKVILQVLYDDCRVFTDPLASPTGFPFKVLKLMGTLSENDVYKSRSRNCDLGYLRHPYKKSDGSLGYRCPAEPENFYVRKDGKYEDTVGRKCLCNGLMSNIGHPQVQKNGYVEPPIVTAGNDMNVIKHFIKNGEIYFAADVVEYLLRGI